VIFFQAALAKQSRQEKPLKEFFFLYFSPQNLELYPVQTFKQYKALTAPLRPWDATKLFISLVKPIYCDIGYHSSMVA